MTFNLKNMTGNEIAEAMAESLGIVKEALPYISLSAYKNALQIANCDKINGGLHYSKVKVIGSERFEIKKVWEAVAKQKGCSNSADDKLVDKKTAAAIRFALTNLVKVADMLDGEGFESLAQLVDEDIGRLSAFAYDEDFLKNPETDWSVPAPPVPEQNDAGLFPPSPYGDNEQKKEEQTPKRRKYYTSSLVGQVQDVLKKAKFYAGNVDLSWGPLTAAAWNKVAVTGKVDPVDKSGLRPPSEEDMSFLVNEWAPKALVEPAPLLNGLKQPEWAK